MENICNLVLSYLIHNIYMMSKLEYFKYYQIIFLKASLSIVLLIAIRFLNNLIVLLKAKI